jgi:predicted nucleic acid-binding protein
VIVVDTSAVVDRLARHPANDHLRRRLEGERLWHAPYLLDIEFLHALRRLVAGNELSEERAAAARQDYADLSLTRYPHQPLADRIWQLRHNLTAYDAVFVALSEALDAPLVTMDARLASAPGHRAHIELTTGS